MTRKSVLIVVAGSSLALIAGTAVASAGDGDDDRGDRRSAGQRGDGTSFELEIDADLDAEFGPRRVDAGQAAAIVADTFPGARVTEAELDERAGGPIWEVTFDLGGRERKIDVDADNGALLGSD